MYCCSLARPQVEGETTGEGAIEPKTETLKIKSIPRKDNKVVKSSTTESTSEQVYGSWFTTVYEPTGVTA